MTTDRFWTMPADLDAGHSEPYGVDTFGIVDEERGGVIAWAHRANADRIAAALRATDGESRTWGWQGDPRTDLDTDDDRRRDTERPAPEGLAVFAHWSISHDGINVEIDLPDGLPLTIHVNDGRVFTWDGSLGGVTYGATEEVPELPEGSAYGGYDDRGPIILHGVTSTTGDAR